VVTWIVVAVCVLAVIVLALAVRPVLGRLGRLMRAADGLRQRQDEALALQARAEALAARVQKVAERAGTAQERITVIRAARGNRERAPEWLTRRAG
jgi:uncharacterized membrane protein YcjF (UPF0283 family)